MDLCGQREAPKIVLEVPKSHWIKGAYIPWSRLHLHLYTLRETLLLEEAINYHKKSSLLAAA
jgi:hypothetical protein